MTALRGLRTARVRQRPLLLAFTALLAVAACSGEADRTSQRATPVDAADATQAATPSDDAVEVDEEAKAALEELLAAEAANDHDRSYTFLSERGRAEYPSVEEWARQRAQLPAITGFEVVEAAESSVIALVEHEPGLDPFVGLSPARERQSWRASQEDGRWVFDGDPEIEPVYPPEERAVDAALEWARAVQRCDEGAARRLEAVEELYGDAAAAAGLCGSEGPVEADDVKPLPSGPASSDVVAQFSADALDWARSVPVRRPGDRFVLILAPIGDDWRVLGVYDE